MNYYPRHIGDYIRDTAHLSALEDCAYTRLLDLYYMRELPIPADVDQAARIARMRSDDERDAVVAVLNEFFTLKADGWHQKRADGEIKIANEKRQKARDNGKRGGRPGRATSDPTKANEITDPVSVDNPEITDPVILANPDESSPITNNQTPIANNQSEVREISSRFPSPASTDHPGFDEFYAAYPRHEAKKDARKAWNQMRPVLNRLLADIRQRLECRHWTDPSYIPLPSTYLRGERWNDAIRAPPKPRQVVERDDRRASNLAVLSQVFTGAKP